MYRIKNGETEFLLVHPGGPFWKNKEAGAWTIPKGEVEAGEDAFETAKREFAEELGFVPQGNFIPLSPVRQKGGKLVHAWAFRSNCDPATCKSNMFEMEWPPRSGKLQQYPEADRAEFFTLVQGREKINPAQVPLLEQAVALEKV